MKKFKKSILTLFSLLILLTSSVSYFAVPPAHAQNTFPWYNQSFPQWYNKVYDTQTSPPQEIFGERYTAAQVQWVIYSLIAFIPNVAGQALTCIFRGGSTDSCVAQNPLTASNTENTPFVYRGVYATIFSPDRPLSGVNYIRSKLASFDIVSQANAQIQGFGFSALDPIQRIWRACRDIMYGFFVLIIIVFAFMIMFRVKLNPQTVVSIQSSIPKIIITLILVTFSYAIAGLMIDLMYVVIGIVALIFSSFGFIEGLPNSWAKIFELLTVGPGADNSTGGMLGWIMGYWWNFVLAFFGSTWTMFSGLGFAGAAAAVLGTIIGIFLVIGVFIWLIITSVKVFVLLIKTYLSILISVIFSPFLIGFGAILPAGGFGVWIKDMISNLMVYPVSGALVLLCVLFLSATTDGVRTSISNWIDLDPGQEIINIFPTGDTKTFWYPPLTLGNQTGTWDPLPILWTFASLGILAMIPNAANMIKSLMAGKGVEGSDLFGKGAALAGGLGMAAGAASGLGGAARRVIVDRTASRWAEDMANTNKTVRWPKRALTSYAFRKGWMEEYRPEYVGQYRAKGRFGKKSSSTPGTPSNTGNP